MSDFYFNTEQIREAFNSIKNALVVKSAANAASGAVFFKGVSEKLSHSPNYIVYDLFALAVFAGFSFVAAEVAAQSISKLRISDLKKLASADAFVAKKTKNWHLDKKNVAIESVTISKLVVSDRRHLTFSSFAAGLTTPLAPAIGYVTLIKGHHIVPDALLPLAIILPVIVPLYFARSAVRHFNDTNQLIKRLALPSPD